MSGNQIPKTEFKRRALEFFRHVETSGESLIVTDHGKPTIEVRPFRSFDLHPLDVLRDSVVRYDKPTDPVAAEEWEAAR